MSDDEIREIADDNDSGRTTSGRRLFSDLNLLLFARAIERASRRAALEDAHTVCLAGVKWSPEPSKQIQFYVNGTCHRLAAEISQLAKETNNG